MVYTQSYLMKGGIQRYMTIRIIPKTIVITLFSSWGSYNTVLCTCAPVPLVHYNHRRCFVPFILGTRKILKIIGKKIYMSRNGREKQKKRDFSCLLNLFGKCN